MARVKDLFGMDWQKEVAPMPEDLIKKMNKLSLEEAIKLSHKHIISRDLQPEVEEMIGYETG
jgi:hypothetical protein